MVLSNMGVDTGEGGGRMKSGPFFYIIYFIHYTDNRKNKIILFLQKLTSFYFFLSLFNENFCLHHCCQIFFII